jgi:hypothetical protein
MKGIFRSLGLAISLYALSAIAQDRPSMVATEAVDAVLTVRAVNYAERTVTFATQQGDLQTIKVPDAAQNLDQVYAGARFKVRYLQSVVVEVVDVDSQPSAQEAQKMELAAKGDNPGGVIVSVKQVTARVEDIDYANRLVAVRGPKGNVSIFKVRPEVRRFGNVQIGDTIVLRYTEALGMSMIKQ